MYIYNNDIIYQYIYICIYYIILYIIYLYIHLCLGNYILAIL